MTFRLTKTAGGASLLTIAFPQGAKAEAKETPAKPPKEVNDQQLAMMKQMLKGMKMSYAVEVDGKIVKTNAPYVEGSTVTLLEMDFDALLADEARFKELTKADPQSLEDAKKLLKDLKGCKVPLVPEITIEFSGK